MHKLGQLSLACFLACSLFANAHAQTSTTLKPGTPIERELGPTQSHDFNVELEANSVLQMAIEQKGIDVIIRVTTPEGKTLGDFDTPNGPNGPENISFVALAAGTYSITVRPLDPVDSKKGRYEISITDLRKATEQELKASKDRELARTKAIELLKDLEGLITQIKTPETRINARIQASELLIEDDEKRARKYLADAIADLKEMVASIDVEDPDYMQQYSAIWQLRFRVVQQLIQTDPEAALNLIYSTAPPPNTFNTLEHTQQENTLEISIANELLSKNPQRALVIARKSLKKGFSLELMRTVHELRNHDLKLAAELANEIGNKLLAERLLTNTEATQFTISLMNASRGAIGSVSTDRPSTASILPEDKYKELVQKVLNEVTSYSSDGPRDPVQGSAVFNLLSALKLLGPELDQVISGGSAMVSKKYDEVAKAHNYITTLPLDSSGTFEETMESVEKASLESRESLYMALANREATSGNFQRAAEVIREHVKNPYQRRQALSVIQFNEIQLAINNGKPEDALRLIGAIRKPSDRAGHLVPLANKLATGQKRATALNLLEQTRALLPASPQAQDEGTMRALIEIARAFANYDSKRAFEIIEPLIDQFNEICAAARVLDGFGGEVFKNDELTQNGNSISDVGSQLTSALGGLALVNFDRAKAGTDRMRLPEVRLRAYLDIAQQVIETPN
jgi:hypothetical protein